MKIKAIKHLKGKIDPIPVYDFAVKDSEHPCAALANGVVVHNCELREMYTPRTPTSMIAHYDYSQFEVRVLAGMANETALLKAFDEGADIHKRVASLIWNKPESEVSASERRYSKGCTFSILYGKGIEAFAEEFMGGDVNASRRFFDDFFSVFPGIDLYVKETHRNVERDGYVTTLFGDPLYIYKTHGNAHLRQAQNYPIQSTASSLAAIGIYNLYDSCKKNGVKAIPIGFTHDSSDYEVEVSDLFRFLDMMHYHAEDEIQKKFNVPAKIDYEIGIHQNHMMELHPSNKRDEQYKFSCPTSTLVSTVERLKKAWNVEYEVNSVDNGFTSLSELFQARRAFSRYLGENVEIAEGNITITSKEEIT